MSNQVNNEIKEVSADNLTLENRLEIIYEGVRKNYLTRLNEMPVAQIGNILPLEEDLINNVRIYRINEMVYQKGESVTDKFTTVFNTLSTFNASVFIIIDSDGTENRIYLGVRNNEDENSPNKRSTVTLGDTLKQTLIGHFPGIKIENEDRHRIASISEKIRSKNNITSVTVVGNSKFSDNRPNEQFVQGLEKLMIAMSGRPYTGLIIADNQSQQSIQTIRKNYTDLYTKISQFQKTQISESETDSESRSQSFSEMDSKQKMAMIGGAAVGLIGMAGGAVLGNIMNGNMGGPFITASIGGQIGGHLGGFINSLAPVKQVSHTKASSVSFTTENKAVTEMMSLIDEALKRSKEYDSYGMWNVAGYFISDDMSTSEIAASNYRSLMNGEHSGREVSAINSWRQTSDENSENFNNLSIYLSRFVHPQFVYGGNILVDSSTSVSGKELGLHLGLPRTTVPGLPVIEHAEFGKEVTSYQLISNNIDPENPDQKITIGKIFDLGKITDKKVELNNRSLNMHTFITGSTGSGKSNAVYQMLTELRQDRIPFLVIEPAKGEYKDAFGHLKDVNVYSTNPNISKIININPFKFPSSIHVLEHVDGLVEIFSVCWPMYDAMPAFFKDAILKSYEEVGWDLNSSTFEDEIPVYPDFETLSDKLDELISNSDYASDIKSNYRGALLTRVRSLTIGLNKSIFTEDQTPYEKIFDENCILDISRVKSTETKALIMGLMVYMLNEYRMDTKKQSNQGLKHITVLEEAHNLLKNRNTGESELVGKSVEMITNTIAEIRTYGEGFIIVDQSPSSVDIAAIKNTNTKIVLRTPEANDRFAIGRSIGLTDDQVNEIAKLPGGVAVVYQNNWVRPVLTMIDKADVKEIPYTNPQPARIKSVREARYELLSMLLQPWLNKDRIRGKVLEADMKMVDIDISAKKELQKCIDNYVFCGGRQIWNENEIPHLKKLVMKVLGIGKSEFERIILSEDPENLRDAVSKKVTMMNDDDINEICSILTRTNKSEE